VQQWRNSDSVFDHCRCRKRADSLGRVERLRQYQRQRPRVASRLL